MRLRIIFWVTGRKIYSNSVIWGSLPRIKSPTWIDFMDSSIKLLKSHILDSNGWKAGARPKRDSDCLKATFGGNTNMQIEIHFCWLYKYYKKITQILYKYANWNTFLVIIWIPMTRSAMVTATRAAMLVIPLAELSTFKFNSTLKFITTGQTSQDISPFHFFDKSHLCNFYGTCHF